MKLSAASPKGVWLLFSLQRHQSRVKQVVVLLQQTCSPSMRLVVVSAPYACTSVQLASSAHMLTQQHAQDLK
jgi:hypothetical protein